MDILEYRNIIFQYLSSLCVLKMKYIVLIGASLSEPHTSKSSGTSVAFTKIYVEIWIAWRVHKSLRLKSDYKPDNLQMLPVRTSITRRITRVVY